MKSLKRMVLPAIVALVSCMPQGILQHDMQTIPADGWRRNDTLTFSVDSAAERAWVCVRIDGTYHFSSVCLRVGRDTVEIPVEGMQGMGLRQCEFPIRCPEPGELKMTHLMQHGRLHGVREVGIKTGR